MNCLEVARSSWRRTTVQLAKGLQFFVVYRGSRLAPPKVIPTYPSVLLSLQFAMERILDTPQPLFLFGFCQRNILS